MSSDILTILQSQSHTFSKGQRLIAKYITESYDKAAFMTASKLGKKVGVSESTVVRFAVELGYDGYPSMQKAIQEMVLILHGGNSSAYLAGNQCFQLRAWR